MNNVMAERSSRSMAELLLHSAQVILTSALALAFIASMDALLCLKLASPPGALDIAGEACSCVLASPTRRPRASAASPAVSISAQASPIARLGGTAVVSVVVNAAMLLAVLALLFPLVAYIPRVALSGVIMAAAIQRIDPWTMQTVRRLMKRDAPQRATIALDLAVAMFVSVVSIALNVVLAVFIGITLALFLFVVRMSRSHVRRVTVAMQCGRANPATLGRWSCSRRKAPRSRRRIARSPFLWHCGAAGPYRRHRNIDPTTDVVSA